MGPPPRSAETGAVFRLARRQVRVCSERRTRGTRGKELSAMAAHAAVPARHHGSLGWVMPAILGVVYGFYAAFVHRNGGAITGGDVVLGVVAGVAFAALAYTLGRFQQSLPRELRAGAYGALCAASMGYLISLAGGVCSGRRPSRWRSARGWPSLPSTSSTSGSRTGRNPCPLTRPLTPSFLRAARPPTRIRRPRGASVLSNWWHSPTARAAPTTSPVSSPMWWRCDGGRCRPPSHSAPAAGPAVRGRGGGARSPPCGSRSSSERSSKPPVDRTRGR